uniref:GST N-terminal domain-containing protein n=1 Tax=Globisporangium ultimum (strain ATCC 200006 / CBS 805.95 / DAOM BR144) TaxID=431595 RepID=K3W5L2_GLOUD
MPVQLYANYVSQPCRALLWVLKVKDADFELVMTAPGSADLKSESFLAMNPNGLVPVLKDGDFALFESNAIFVYVAEKFGWTDLYPTDPLVRAKINEFLHWHHTNSRLFTLKIVRPVLGQKLGRELSAEDLIAIEKKDEVIDRISSLMEKFLTKDYIARTDAPTIADYIAYCEYDQLEMMGTDFSKYPKVHAWLARMKDIPYHDEVRETLGGFLKAIGMSAAAKP